MKKLVLTLFLVILLTNFVLATDVAYVVRTQADSALIAELDYAGLTYDVITDLEIPSTNFSHYEMILVGEGKLENYDSVPVEKHNSLIMNSYHFYKKTVLLIPYYQWGLSSEKGSASSPTNIRFNTLNTPLIENLPEYFKAYTVSDVDLKTYYLAGKKATGMNLIVRIDGHTSADAVIGTAYPGTVYLNGKIGQGRVLFFGIVEPEYWTAESTQLFRNSLNWVLIGEDKDSDGFYTGEDCNDSDFDINPDAEEIPYDFIDQDCDGYDLADVDEDGYCEEGYAIQNKFAQCFMENGFLGSDCDDYEFDINPGSLDLSLNCINDAPTISIIPNISTRELQIVTITIFAEDSEEDELEYSINDSRFIQIDTNLFEWQTDFYDAGNYTFAAIVSDGEFIVTRNFMVEIREKNQAPILIEMIPNQEWNEDENLSLNLSEYFEELDFGDILTFGIANTSQDTHIIVESINEGVINFIVEENWNGEDWIIFFAYDGQQDTESNNVTLTVLPVNDEPLLKSQIPNQTWNEDEDFELNLNDYFEDMDSDLDYSIYGNSNVDVTFLENIATFNPEENWNGEESIIISASDGEFEISSNEFILKVIPVNDEPILSYLIPAQIWGEDENLLLDLSEYFEELDFGNNITFGIANTSQDTHIIVESIEEGVITFAVQENWNGEDWIIFFANDEEYETLSNNVTLTVLPVNDEPILKSQIPNQTWNEDEDFELNLNDYFEDIDSDLSYSVYGNSNVDVTFLENIATFNPEENWNGEESIIISASDGEFEISSNEFILKVIPVNDEPILDYIEDVFILAGGLVKVNATATDIEESIFNFTFSSPLNYLGEWQTTENDVGIYDIVAEVNDGNGGIDSQEFNIQVINKFYINEFVANPESGNEWIEVYNPFEQEINLDNCEIIDGAGNVFALEGILGYNEFSFVEMDNKLNTLGDILTLYCYEEIIDTVTYGNWDDENLSDNAENPELGKSASRNPDGLDTGNNFEDFEIFEYPTKGLPSNADLFAPAVELSSPSDNSFFNETRTVTFEFIAKDNVAEILECTLYIDGKSNKSNTNVENDTIQSITAESIQDGVHDWTIECYDGTNYAFALEERIIEVNAPDSPIFNSISTKYVNENETLTFIISATDADLDNLYFSIQNPPEGASIEDNFNGTATFSWTPTYEQAGQYSTVFVVEDSTGLWNQATATIVVNDKKMPPQFKDIDRCERINSSLEITITNPDDGQKFEIGKTINVRTRIKNSYSEDLSVDVEAYLYDINEEEIIKEEKEKKINIDEGKYGTSSINLVIPSDIDVENDFAIFVLAEGENGETLCNEEFLYIEIERKDYELNIEKIFTSQESVLPGESVDITVKVRNTGGKDENVYVEIKNYELNILSKSEEFELESYGDDDEDSVTLTIEIPKNAAEKSYNLEIKAIGEESQDSETVSISVIKQGEIGINEVIYSQEGKTEPSQQKIELIKLNKQENSGFIESFTGLSRFKSTIIILLVIILLLAILIFLIKKL